MYCGQVPLSDYPDAGITCRCPKRGTGPRSDDEGHTGDPTDGSWAKNGMGLRTVFGPDRPEHSLAEMSRAVITAFYGQPAAFTYYDGCSTGRPGKRSTLAQRYPARFQRDCGRGTREQPGAAGAFRTHGWSAATPPEMVTRFYCGADPGLHAAVVRAWNAQGIISDPRLWRIDPHPMLCPPDTAPTRA